MKILEGEIIKNGEEREVSQIGLLIRNYFELSAESSRDESDLECL